MTEQEKINTDVQMKLAMQDAKFNTFMQEMRDFKTEMRDRDNQRAADIREIRTELASVSRHVRNLTVAAMVGIGASVMGIGAIAVSVVYSILTR